MKNLCRLIGAMALALPSVVLAQSTTQKAAISAVRTFHKPSHKSDALQQELELNAADFDGLRQHMKEVRAFDESVAARTDISLKKAHAMSSEALVLQSTKSGLFVVYMLYSNPTIGIYRAVQTSPTLVELSKRNDLGKAFADAYTHMQLDPSKDPRFYKESGPMRMIATDLLVQYPPIRRKLAGHEKELVLAMGDALARAKKVDATFPKGKEIYGAFPSTVGAAARILAQANPNLKVDVTEFKTADAAMNAILGHTKTLK